MKRLLGALLLALAVVVAVAALRRALAADTTRIRWLIEARAEAFNDAHLLTCMRGFAPGYHDDSARVGRGELQQALLYLFTRRRGYRLEIADDGIEVELTGGDEAKAAFTARLLELRGGAPHLVWEIDVGAELRRLDGSWKIARSRHRTLSGRRPGR